MANLALDAVLCVAVNPDGTREVDIKKYAKIEKIAGARDCRVLKGVMMNKDVVAPAHEPPRKKLRVMLLDCSPIQEGREPDQRRDHQEEDWATPLKMEEEDPRAAPTIGPLKPDAAATEKGLSDLATHYLTKAGIVALRRVRKTDNNRIARDGRHDRAQGREPARRTSHRRRAVQGGEVREASLPDRDDPKVLDHPGRVARRAQRGGAQPARCDGRRTQRRARPAVAVRRRSWRWR